MTTKLTSYVEFIGSEKFYTFYHDGILISGELFADLLLDYAHLDPDYDRLHYNNIITTDICDVFIFHY